MVFKLNKKAKNEISELDLWLAAAEAVRSTCQNLREFDALIAAHRRRRKVPGVKDILHNGEVMPIGHLAPKMIGCPCEHIKRDLSIRVIFANHCYTEEFSAEKHSHDQIILYDSPDRPRVFCPIRYKLSHRLPDLIDALPAQRVHQTTQVRNYVYVVPLKVERQVYEIYFMLQRAQAEDAADLRLTIESAYPVEVPSILPKRPSTIRFRVLAYKVLANQPVKFAAR
jgi:hypothetical protein